MKRSILISSLVVLFAVVNRADAVSTLFIGSAPSSITPNTTVNNLYIDFDFFLAEQHLAVELTSGSIVYDACPQCDLSDDDTSTAVFLGSPLNPPPIANVISNTPTGFEVTWSPDPLSIFNQYEFYVARVALSNDAQGSWSYKGEETALAAFLPAAPTIRGTILGGVMIILVPEPTALAQIALACAAMGFHRRR